MHLWKVACWFHAINTEYDKQGIILLCFNTYLNLTVVFCWHLIEDFWIAKTDVIIANYFKRRGVPESVGVDVVCSKMAIYGYEINFHCMTVLSPPKSLRPEPCLRDHELHSLCRGCHGQHNNFPRLNTFLLCRHIGPAEGPEHLTQRPQISYTI